MIYLVQKKDWLKKQIKYFSVIAIFHSIMTLLFGYLFIKT